MKATVEIFAILFPLVLSADTLILPHLILLHSTELMFTKSSLKNFRKNIF